MAVGRRRTPQAPRSERCAVRRALRPAVVVLAALALLAAASGCVEEDAPDAPSPVATAVASASPVLTPTVPTPDVQPGVATGPAEGDSSVPALRVARNDVGTTLEIELVPISAGVAHTCRVEANGAVVCWGSNTYGEDHPPEKEVRLRQRRMDSYLWGASGRLRQLLGQQPWRRRPTARPGHTAGGRVRVRQCGALAHVRGGTGRHCRLLGQQLWH